MIIFVTVPCAFNQKNGGEQELNFLSGKPGIEWLFITLEVSSLPLCGERGATQAKKAATSSSSVKGFKGVKFGTFLTLSGQKER